MTAEQVGGVAPDAGSVCAMAGTIIAIDSSRTVALDLISASLAFWGEAPLCPVRSAIATLQYRQRTSIRYSTTSTGGTVSHGRR